MLSLLIGDIVLFEQDDIVEEDVIGAADVKSWAFFTFETLASTDNGVTFPTTVNFFAAKSMLNDVTPVNHT